MYFYVGKVDWYLQRWSPNSNCSGSNITHLYIGLLASYFQSLSEHLMLILFL